MLIPAIGRHLFCWTELIDRFDYLLHFVVGHHLADGQAQYLLVDAFGNGE